MSESEKARESASAGGGGATGGSAGGAAGGEGTVAKPKAQASKAQPKSKKAVRTRTRRKSKQLPPYNVILLDDNHHTYAYVIEMLRKLFGHPEERGNQLAKEVDASGRVIVMTTHKELAELKRDQIHAFGADWRLETSKGSMSAKIERAK
jgi:ATP-dependent Clp protease adaptor protein ClpS